MGREVSDSSFGYSRGDCINLNDRNYTPELTTEEVRVNKCEELEGTVKVDKKSTRPGGNPGSPLTSRVLTPEDMTTPFFLEAFVGTAGLP